MATTDSVFIASPDAPEYERLLRDKLGPGIEFSLAKSLDEASSLYGDQAIVLGRPDFVARILATEPPLRWAQSTWAGVTPLIELPYRDYQLTGVKEVFGPQMAEYVMGYLLAHELSIEARRERQRQHLWDNFHSGRVGGKTLGVMGTGSIGIAIATMARQLGLRVLGYNSKGAATEAFELVYSRESLHTFLKQCDYLVGVLPDLPATTGLLGAEALAVMKRTAVLINVGRGNLIDAEALCLALREGHIAAAVLDVFAEEPLPTSSPLWDTPGLTVTAHVAAVSHPQDIAAIFVDNFQRYREGQPLKYLVDFDKGY